MKRRTNKSFWNAIGFMCKRISPVGMKLIEIGKYHTKLGYKNESFTKMGLERFEQDLMAKENK